ncbi:MAG: SNF2 helicase associated domain-containing protein, partial [Romboutsia sp.]|nr:SNF2 helicase associated domain-containing protein [Romboutsia sp.]
MDKISINNIIENNTDRNRYNAGYMYFKRNLVKDFYYKNDDNVSTFYGTVIDDYANYTSLIMINNKTRVIVNCRCDCKDFISKDNQPRICSHIVATVLKGLEGNDNNEDYEKDNESIIDPSISLTINQSRNGYMGLDLEIEGIDKNEYRRVFNAYKEKKKLYRISNGGYLNLQNKDLIDSF